MRRAGVLSVPALVSSCLGSGRSCAFLALLLLSAPQEVVREPPHGVRGSAYRTRDPAYCIPYRMRHSAYRFRRDAVLFQGELEGPIPACVYPPGHLLLFGAVPARHLRRLGVPGPL